MSLPSPITLPAGFQGTIVAENYQAGEPNGNIPLVWTTDDGNGSVAFVGGGRFGLSQGVFPTSVDGGPANRYAAGTFMVGGLPVTVNNVAPTVDVGPDHDILAGQFVDKNASFTDPGFDCPNPTCNPVTTEDFISTINWGDGSPIEDVTPDETPGAKRVLTTGTVTGRHQYLLPGEYTVTVTVCDDDGGCDSDT